MTTRIPSRSSRLIAIVAVVGAIVLTAGVTGAQAAQWLPPLSAIGRSMLAQEGIVQGNDVRQGPLSPAEQMLVTRWSQLFAAVLAEFQADHRSPVANIEGDFTTRELRIRRTVGEDAWVTRTLTTQQLASADLRALAKRLYAESKR